MLSFFARWHLMYGPLLGGAAGWFTLYMVVRTVESHWFVWVTQMSHLSMRCAATHELNMGRHSGRPPWLRCECAAARSIESALCLRSVCLVFLVCAVEVCMRPR